MLTASQGTGNSRRRLIHLLPEQITQDDKETMLKMAIHDKRRHQIIMKHAAKRNDFQGYARAKQLFERACDSVDAWEMTCGEVA